MLSISRRLCIGRHNAGPCYGEDPLRDEERAYLLVYLREFAAADGALPVDFDSLVRESFGELVGGPSG